MPRTKISHKSLGTNRNGDNRTNLKDIPHISSKKEIRKALTNPSTDFIYVTDNELFAINKLTYKKKPFLLLEPNPVTFYYSIVYDLIPQMVDARKQFEMYLSAELYGSKEDKEMLHISHSYFFKVASIGVIFSFSALEAFMNQQLPDYANIELNGKLLTKDDIQRWATFDDKMQKIIPKLTGRNFCKVYPAETTTIKNLKKLRDELIHLKQKRKDGLASYNDIYQDILNLNLNHIVLMVKKYINFYDPKLIQDY
jgi:hypothetical protein